MKEIGRWKMQRSQKKEERKSKRNAKRENDKIKWKNIKIQNSGTGKDVSDTINVII